MNAPQQIETSQATPEQLVQMLDLQLASARGKRMGRSRNRAIILAFGLLAIMAAGGIALIVAQQMLLDLQLARERAKRPGRSRNRAMILVFGLLAIVAAGAVALMIAQQILLDLHERGGAQRSEMAAPTLEK